MPKQTEFHAAVSRALSSITPRFETVDETASTNDDAKALARAGAPDLSVVIADRQRAGRGRLGRAWVAEPGTSLLMSWVSRPGLPVERWTVLPLIAGVAAAEAVRGRTTVEVLLKWPNDLMVGEAKLGGILVEAEPPSFAVVGVGVNVSQTTFPPDLTATSIALAGGRRLDRADLAAAVLVRFAEALADVDAAMARYRVMCSTIGRAVRVERQIGPLDGVAEGIDDDGALRVNGERIAAGDVTHLRALG